MSIVSSGEIHSVAPAADLKHDTEFWFDDGSIVLIARNTAFRVYRQLLATQSTLFSDLFVASSARPDEAVDGCPAVRLTDSPEDFRHLLRLLLPQSNRIALYRDDSEEPISFTELSVVIRISHKYQVEYALRTALAHLKRYYTNDFYRWVIVSESKDPIIDPVHAIGAANIARLTDTPTILPIALYQCCRLGDKLVDGWTREDGTVEHLCSEDLKRCIRALHSRLAQEALDIVLSVYDGGSECACYDIRKSLLEEALNGEHGDVVTDVDLFTSWEEAYAGRMCHVCEEDVQEQDVHARLAVWNALPSIFNVSGEGWHELST